jgi:hypothetical protein
MKKLARFVCGLGFLLVLGRPAAAVDITGSWSVCFPPDGAFCPTFIASMIAANDAFTIKTSFCEIHGTVNPTTGAMTVPPGECPQGPLSSFTGTATDTSFTATVSFLLCLPYNVTGVRECPACDDGEECTIDGCGATPCSAPSSSCTGAFMPQGTSCDDGQSCTGPDVCGSDNTAGECHGPAILCNDNNPCTDDGCDTMTGDCVFTPNSAPCQDASLCTTGDTCSGGTCVGGPAVECAPCEVCKPLAGCLVGPRDDCKPSLGKDKISLKDSPVDAKDKIKWTWGRGEATTAGELGSPVTTDDYTLCVYDRPLFQRRLFLDATAPADGSCVNGGSCWSARGTPPGSKGFIYKDSKILLPDGLKRVKLQPGIAGKAKAQVSGLGANLALPSPMNVGLPVVVQLQGENGTCFESVFTTAKQNVEDSFKAANSPSAAFVDAW